MPVLLLLFVSSEIFKPLHRLDGGGGLWNCWWGPGENLFKQVLIYGTAYPQTTVFEIPPAAFRQ